MGNEQSGHHKNGAEKLTKTNQKNKDIKPEETSGVSEVVNQDSDTKETAAEASVGLANVLPVSTGTSSEISTAETVTNNQVQNEIPVEKEIYVDPKTSSHEPQVVHSKPVELTKTETFFYECKQEEPGAKIDAIPESSLVVEKAVAIPKSSVVVEKPVAKTESNDVIEKQVTKTDPIIVTEKPIAKTDPNVDTEKPIAKAKDSSKDSEKPVLLQSLLNLEGDTSQRIGESSRTIDSTIGHSGRTTLLSKETLELQQKFTEKQVIELERVSTDTLNAPLLTVTKDDGSESPRKEIVGKENLKRNKSFISSLMCCTAP